MYDVYEIRKDFPILSELINGKPNTFLDTAASAQKPRQVIEKMNGVYFGQYANVHRGSYYLSEQATAEYENARRIAADFIQFRICLQLGLCPQLPGMFVSHPCHCL